ncbi:MAG: hypothetical protein IT291_04995 [Deltaproteobacteria bacterium]|nr:hypothetical protein [Deltaproteobacteria bacterium]
MKRTGKALVVAILLVAFTSQANAATDGTLGTTSTGDLDITVTIPDLVMISGFVDIAFGVYGGTGDLTSNQNLCVYRNATAGQYTITATSAEGAFQVEAGALTLAYSVYFNDVTGTAGEIALVYNTATVTQSGANTTIADCSVGGDSANVHVTITEANLQAAEPGAYSGTLILLATPV